MFRIPAAKSYLPLPPSPKLCTYKPEATKNDVGMLIAAPFVIAALSGYVGFRMGYRTCEYDHYVARFKDSDRE